MSQSAVCTPVPVEGDTIPLSEYDIKQRIDLQRNKEYREIVLNSKDSFRAKKFADTRDLHWNDSKHLVHKLSLAGQQEARLEDNRLKVEALQSVHLDSQPKTDTRVTVANAMQVVSDVRTQDELIRAISGGRR